MIDLNSKRGTGRTTRMLFDAIQKAYHIQVPVAVVAATHTGAIGLRFVANSILGVDNPILKNLSFKSLSSSDVITNSSGVIALGYTYTFVDHHAYAVLLQDVNPLIAGYHKYDEHS